MHENSRAIRFLRTEAERAQTLDDAECLPRGPDKEPVRQTTPTQAVMEYFGEGCCRTPRMQQLLRGGDVSRSGVGVGRGAHRRRHNRPVLHDDGGANCAERGRCRLRPSSARECAHLLREKIDRIRTGSQQSLGHREVRLPQQSDDRFCSGMATGFASSGRGSLPRARGAHDVGDGLCSCIPVSECRRSNLARGAGFPAVIVDEDLHIHELNGGGRTLLTKGELLRPDGTRLAASSSDVTEGLRKQSARHWFREPVSDRRIQRYLCQPNTRQFAFAKISAVPALSEGGKALVVVPIR